MCSCSHDTMCFAYLVEKLGVLPLRRGKCIKAASHLASLTDEGMTEAANAPERPNYYDALFGRLIAAGDSALASMEHVADAYLEGKPATLGKHKTTRRDRDRLFWECRALQDCDSEAWRLESMVLALARYIGQEPVAVSGLMSRAAVQAPEALIRAVRYSGLVLNQHSPRRTELQEAAAASESVAELCRVLDIFDLAYRDRVAAVQMWQESLNGLSPFDLLVHASLYAFEKLVPRDLESTAVDPQADNAVHLAWDAIGDLLVWRLRSATDAMLGLDEDGIGQSLAQHLEPILFEVDASSDSEAHATYLRFNQLMAAQIELNEFTARSADAFSYDDGIKFVRQAERLEIVEVDPSASLAWRRDGRKLDRLHGYWFHRALAAFADSDAARATMGRPENQDANRMAWIRALQGQLRAQEVYGVADEVTADTGEAVDLFRALLALNLMSAHHLRDFLAAFADQAKKTGDCISALHLLAMDGMLNERQNRLPLTWSGRDVKIRNITGWTVTAAHPQGSARQAGAILDFWTYDVASVADRLRDDARGLEPQLFERPVLKFGKILVQLPWVVGMQNNSTAAINNLRRLGARRGQAREETQRIETNLARLLEQRGFAVLTNWEPPCDQRDAGEVDLIAARDGHVFVLEIKSTFIRRKKRDAWLHATTTLRKAGRQLQRKVEAVTTMIECDDSLRAALGLESPPADDSCHSWIVDTSIEWDHQRFSGFLKVSVEEMLIALRDDRDLLDDPYGLLSGQYQAGEIAECGALRQRSTLYPHGFNVERFIEVVEAGEVWREM